MKRNYSKIRGSTTRPRNLVHGFVTKAELPKHSHLYTHTHTHRIKVFVRNDPEYPSAVRAVQSQEILQLHAAEFKAKPVLLPLKNFERYERALRHHVASPRSRNGFRGSTLLRMTRLRPGDHRRSRFYEPRRRTQPWVSMASGY